MPERGPTSPYLALCEVCGAEVFHSHKTDEPSAQHLKSREHRAAIERRKREAEVPESRDRVRVMVQVEWASMPRGSLIGASSFAWRSLPRDAVPALATALHRTLDRFAPCTVGQKRASELWVESAARLPPDRSQAEEAVELELDFAQPARGRADTRACSATPATRSPGTTTSPSSGRTGAASARPSRSGDGAASSSPSSRRGKLEPVSQRGKRSRTKQAERLEAVKVAARAKRAELGLEPVPPENLEYEAAQAARKAKRKRQ